MNDLPKIGAIAPWYGSNRTFAREVGEMLKGFSWVGIPFAGSMTEIQYIGARTLLVNDKHRALMNLACIMGDAMLGPELYRRLRRRLFHPEELEHSQDDSKMWGFLDSDLDGGVDRLLWAESYFLAVWMGRSAKAGTDNELSGGLSLRWNASGGDSAVRYQNAVRSIPAWRRLFRRCTFSALDVFHFLDKCKDEIGTGIYCDPPFPGPGDKYVHKFTIEQHRQLACRLTAFKHARIVCRFYDVPLIRELYDPKIWNWLHLKGRDQANAAKPEVLLQRN